MKRGELLLRSLGFAPRRTPTLDALSSLARCAVVFYDEPSRAALPVLRLFCGDCRPMPGEAEAALRPALRGDVVGCALYGQPMVFGPRLRRLVRRAEELGVAVSTGPGLSAFDGFLTARREVFGYGPTWRQVLEDCRPEALAAAGRLDPRLPSVFFFPPDAPPEAWRAAVEFARASYPASRPCEVFELSEDGARRALRRLSVGGLAGAPAPRAGAPAYLEVSPEEHGR